VKTDLYPSPEEMEVITKTQSGVVVDTDVASITCATISVTNVNNALAYLGDKIDALQAALRKSSVVG